MHSSPEPSGASGSDGRTPQAGEHLPFYEALEVASESWGSTLERTGRDDLALRHFAIVNVNADFRREMFRGQVDAVTVIEKVGTSSIALATSFTQHGQQAGTARAVLVRISADRVTSVALSHDQREALARLLG